MEKIIVQISVFVIICVSFLALTAYTTADDPKPKEYITIMAPLNKGQANFDKLVSDKLAEGWHLEGGVAYSIIPTPQGAFIQAMSK